MRIISGSLKGRTIKYLRNSNTRPLKDSVKENIFNILSHSNIFKTKIKDSNILDLYSGIGSFGIECISRDAQKVTFIEKNLDAIKVLKGNLNTLLIENKSKLYSGSIENFLKKKIDEKFNIFFFDPPFLDLNFLSIIKKIKDKGIFNRDNVVIIHREAKSKEDYINILDVLKTKKYGRSKIIFGKFN